MNSDDLISRIKLLIGAGSARSFAQKAGISPSTLRSILMGHRPNVENLISIADAAGVSLDWLAKGTEPMGAAAPAIAPPEPQPPAQPSAIYQQQPLDEDLHASIADGISKAYRDANARLSPADLGRLSARMHGELIDLYDDPADRAVGLKALLRQLQRDLQAPPSKSDKRSA